MGGVVAAQDAGDGLGVGEVLLFEDAGGEGCGCVVVVDGDGVLADDDAVVDGLVDEVDGASGDLCTVVEGLLLGVESREGWEQRGVDVEDTVRKGGHEGGRDDAHVSGEADEIDLVLVEAVDHLGVVLGALATGGGDGEGREVELAGRGEAGSVLEVGEDDGDLGVVEAVFADGGGYGEEVGAAAGEKDA